MQYQEVSKIIFLHNSKKQNLVWTSLPDSYEECWTKEIEQRRRAYRWEEGHCLQCCHFKRRECIIQPLLCTGEENLHEHQGYYQHTVCEELKEVQIKVKVKKKEKM